MTQNQSKIQGKFYPLQASEWVNVCKSLTKSQMTVLYYLRSSDPYSNGIKVKTSQIAEEIGITTRAVNAAFAVLQEKGYITLGDVEYSVKVNPGGCLCDSSESVTHSGNSVPTQEENFSPENRISHSGNSVPTQEENFSPENRISHSGNSVPTQEENFSPENRISHPGNSVPTQEENFSPENRISHSSAETTAQQEVETSKINKTYKDFQDSLSEEQRESFLSFVNQKIASLPKPPTLPNKWIEAHFEELEVLWKKQMSTNGSTHCGAENSRNVLDFENWDKSSHQGQYHALMNVGLARFCENPTSKAWYEWAVVKYPERFVEVPS